ncbi:MAG: 23S rRNA (guanosine(2251)-2'-O)-methyltransferase RlmB [bacterium]
MEIIYGRNPVLEAIRAKREIGEIHLVADLRHAKLAEISRLARKQGIPVKKVSKQAVLRVAGEARTQGVVAFVRGSGYVPVDEILRQSETLNEPPLIACLDSIEDPHNLGAILRSADGAGFHGVILPKRRSAGLTATVAKTSAGASAHILTAQVANLNAVMEELKNKNIWFVGADQDAKQAYTEVDLTGSLAVVVGAEGSGLHRLVKEKCDFLVRIPMYGKVNSLNASVAAALLFFEIRRQRESGR